MKKWQRDQARSNLWNRVRNTGHHRVPTAPILPKQKRPAAPRVCGNPYQVIWREIKNANDDYQHGLKP